MKITKFFAMALVAFTMLSCNKSIDGGTPGGDQGINTPTYATFKFNIGSSSKAAGDYDPTSNPDKDIEDKAIGSLQLLIFNAQTQALEHNKVLDAGTTSETVLLTAGQKKIFFVANSNKLTNYAKQIAPATFTVGAATLTEFYAMSSNAGTPQKYNAVKATAPRTFNFDTLYMVSDAGKGGLPMSNTNGVTYTLASGVTSEQASGGNATTDGVSITNTFKVQLYYMVAKARLKLATGVLNTDAAKPIIKDVTYAVRNLARVTNYVQNVPVKDNPQSYYFSKTFADSAAFSKEFDDASNIVIAATETDGNYLYVPENNSQLLSRGQSSYFAIKATYEPIVITAVAHDINTTIKYTQTALASGATNKNYIYTLKDVHGIAAGTYFQTVELLQEAAWILTKNKPFTPADRTEAAQLVAKTDYVSFLNATSYYRVDLGDGTGADTKYGVLRSNKYNAIINKITGPGVPTEGDLTTDPTNPVSAKTNIHATIVAAEWSQVNQNADL